MNWKKISVVIPVYNARRYLNKCLRTISRQTYKNLEIILVNDGSSDDSQQVCEEWAQKDDRIKVIKKINGGVSSARNVGIENAVGEYIMFVDADDWLPLDAIDKLVKGVEKLNADFCFGSAIGIGALSKETYAENEGLDLAVSDTEKFVNYTEILKTELSPWAKLYRKSIIDTNLLRFPEGVAYGEDRIFNWKFLQECVIVSAISENVYYYSQLNLTRACGKYYSDVNKWMHNSISEYIKIYKTENEQVKKVISATICNQFKFCCEHYIENASVIGEEKAISKIKETISLFDEFSEYVEKQNNSCLFHYQDAMKIYMKLSEQCGSNEKIEMIKTEFRNVIVRIKQAIVYR